MNKVAVAKELVRLAKALVAESVQWKKNIIEKFPSGGMRYEYVGGGYTIDVSVSADKDQGHPGSNSVTVLAPKGWFLHGGTKSFKTAEDAEKYVEEVKQKLEKGDKGKKIPIMP